jgi:isoleucyl-tRNA synthetase
MAMDYKDTLNLPRTDFAMKADLVAREPQRLAKWQAEDLYGQIQQARAGSEKFILHDGPPFANGDVHIGTALNKILKDIILRYQTIRGKAAPYVPGWDCHGLPIEFKVSQELRKGSAAAPAAGADASAATFNPATIRTACEAYARKYINLQREQFKRLGVLGEWDKPYLTLDKEYEADELRLFADIVEKGFVYRGKKPVYWSIPARTALAEAEVEYKDHVSPSIYVKFPVVGRPGTFILIWTTTPWTLPANLAVACHSTFNYSQVLANGETYLVSTMLLPAIAQKAGWEGYDIRQSLTGDQLIGVEFQHPFCNRTGKIFAGDSFVTQDTGTGFVHIAPGHGQEDYQLGLANGLPIYSPVDDDGCLAHTNDLPVEQQMPAELVGKAILEKHHKSEANEAVLELLRTKNALLHQEAYTHSYPHCWRSKTPVIFRAMDQWFIRIDHKVGQVCNLSSDGGNSRVNIHQLADYLGAEIISGLLQLRIPFEALSLVPKELARKCQCLPLEFVQTLEGRSLKVVFADPLNISAVDQIGHQAGRPLHMVVAEPDEVLRAIEHFYPAEDRLQACPTFRESALAEIDQVTWIPDWGKNRIRGAVESRPDWCISRQRSWGVPIPAFYDADKNPILDARIVRNVADLIEQHGSNVWFEKEAAELWSLVKPADWSGPEAVAKSADTLDVWIDSGSSSRAVTAKRPELNGRTGLQPVSHVPVDGPGSADSIAPDACTHHASRITHHAFQADMYLEGSDQHRGWFQSSLLLSLAGNGAAPYKTVLTHGFMVDADREKISKSKQGQGGYEKPQTAEAYVKNYGADVVRLWVASQDFRNDIVVSDERVKKVSETYRGLRNALRYQLSNLYDFDPAQHTVPDDQLTSLDRWILWKLSQVEAEVAAAYDQFEFHVVYQKLSQFAAVELSAMYHDLVKDRLYTDPAGSHRRRSTQTALHRLVTSLCQMLSPILVFTTDEAWEFVPGRQAESPHLSVWGESKFQPPAEELTEWNLQLAVRERVLATLENLRRDKVIGKSLEARVEIAGLGECKAFAKREESLRELTNVSQLKLRSDSLLDGKPVGEVGLDKLEIAGMAAAGQKCARCWHVETDVGTHPEHPTICGRCVQAVTPS